ncbi:MAG: putative lipid II flippase FtsW [Deltaproteobacteria bacterium]|nr:putative lipid II flippase FtsW [Deltaproteobacteria bacterium]
MLRLLVFVPVLLLILYGLVMVFSSSMIFSSKRFDDPMYFLNRQLIFASLGLAIMLVASRLPVEMYRRFTVPLLAVSFIGLLLCLTPFGTTVKGATRWISIGGGFNIQPSEFAKVALVFYVSYSMSKKAERIKNFKVGFLPHALVAIVFAGLCMKQPDFGAAMMIVLLTFVMLFVGGTRLGYILGSGLLMVPVAYSAVVFSPYRMKRIMAFLNPEQDALGINYQITESLISIGSGGIWGVGLGLGKQKLFFLPDAHTDFIASIVGEELGMLGIFILLLLFGTIVAAGLVVSMRSRTRYGSFLAAGLTFYLAFQVVVNMGVIMGLLPTKGLALPFVSYGGSSLITNLFAAGVLMSMAGDVEKREEEPGVPSPTRRSGNFRLSHEPLEPADVAGVDP